MSESNFEPARAIGEKLRAVRQQREMSLRELAERANMSASMLSQIETGKTYPSVRSIYSIAAALNVPVDYFFPDQQNGDPLSAEADPFESGELTASEMREAQVGRAATEFARMKGSPTPVIHADSRPTIELKGGVTWSRLTA